MKRQKINKAKEEDCREVLTYHIVKIRSFKQELEGTPQNLSQEEEYQRQLLSKSFTTVSLVRMLALESAAFTKLRLEKNPSADISTLSRMYQ